MAEVGSAYVSLMPSARGFGSKMESELSPEVTSAGKGIGSKFGTLFKVGAVAAVGGALVVGKFLKGAVEEAREAQIVTARTENVIKRMGGVANVSAKQVADLAGAISKKTGIDDEAIQSGQNLLLTFGNIRNEAGKGNDIFNRTSQLMVDMSAAMGTDAKGSAIQLGKALNDPIKGVTALTRSGVSFTEQQKEQIKTLVESGKTLDAQKLILGEVEKQFGGAAESMATPADKVAVAWGNVKEQIGTALLPVLDNVLNKVLAWMPAITAGIDSAIGSVKGFVADVKGLFSGGDGVSSGASSFVAILTGTVLPALQSAGTYLKAELLPAVMGVVNAFKYQFQQIAPVVVEAVAGMVARLAPYWPQIKAALVQVVSTFKSSLELIATVVRTGTDVLTAVWEKFGSRFMDYLASTFRNVVTIVRGALNIVQGIIRLVTSVIKGDWSGAWDAIKQILRGAWDVIRGIVSQGLNTLKSMLSNLGAVLKALFSKAWDLAKEAVSAGIRAQIDLVKSLPGRIKGAIGDLGSLLYNAGRELLEGLARGMLSKLGDIAATASSIASKIKGFFPGSPVKEGPLTSWNGGGAGKRLIQMLADGIIAGTPAVVSAAKGAADGVQKAVLDRLTSMRDSVKGVLDGLRSDFDSLASSVASAFTGDLFNFDNVRDFMVNLVGTRSELVGLKRAFKKLVGWGVAPQFLSSLFSSGNGGLILELAKGDRITALTAASVFDDIGTLSGQLGSQVARADIGPKIDATNRKLERMIRAIDKLPENFGREINNSVGSGQRRAS